MSHAIIVDVESFGGVTLLHGFAQLRAALIRVDDQKILETFEMCANQRGFVKEPRCVEEYWSMIPEKYEALQRKCEESSKTPFEVVAEFVSWVKRVAGHLDDVFLGYDNVYCDIGVLRTFSTFQDIQYLFGKCRDIVHVNWAYYGMDCFWSSQILFGRCKKK
jgi:hypothetical protein